MERSTNVYQIILQAKIRPTAFMFPNGYFRQLQVVSLNRGEGGNQSLHHERSYLRYL
jgi:hypothetical protein